MLDREIAVAAAFDTLAAAEALEAAGMDPRQAKARAAQMRDAAGASRAELATKADLEAGLASLEARLFRALWMQAAAIVATLTALAGLAIGLATLVGA